MPCIQLKVVAGYAAGIHYLIHDLELYNEHCTLAMYFQHLRERNSDKRDLHWLTS